MLYYIKIGYKNKISIFKAYISEQRNSFEHLKCHYIEKKGVNLFFDQERLYDLLNLPKSSF